LPDKHTHSQPTAGSNPWHVARISRLDSDFWLACLPLLPLQELSNFLVTVEILLCLHLFPYFIHTLGIFAQALDELPDGAKMALQTCIQSWKVSSCLLVLIFVVKIDFVRTDIECFFVYISTGSEIPDRRTHSLPQVHFRT
jgi:hypothetical protein